MKQYKHTEDSMVEISELMLPSHSNFGGKIHGGYILNLMDQIAFACASKHSEAYCVTASVNTVDFLNPIEVGELVTMKAAVNYTGNTSMVIGIRVESQIIQTGEIKHCNSSYFTMVAKGENGDNKKVPGIIIDSKDKIRRFVRSIKRAESRNRRKNAFNEQQFDHNNYMELLRNCNVKILLRED